LLTSTSQRPKRSYTVSISRSQSAQRPAWNSTGSAVRPVAALISAAAAVQLPSLRLAITTSAPASAKPAAMARPMPRLPPVTTAT
jgi:hypothetical protein